MLTYKAIHGIAPYYIQELVKIRTPPRSLRSNLKINQLVEPRYKSDRSGGRAFSNVAPRIWNALPSHIRAENSFDSFKKLVKTHYFSLVYK